MIRDKHKETRQEDVAAYRQFLNRNYISSDFAT